MPSSGRSVQWTAFLMRSTPYMALMLLGATARACEGSWGPQIPLNEVTTFSYRISMAMQAPTVSCSAMLLNSGITPFQINRMDALGGYFVDFEELLCRRSVQLEYLHRRNFESFILDMTDDFSCLLRLQNMGLDNAAAAVLEKGRILLLYIVLLLLLFLFYLFYFFNFEF